MRNIESSPWLASPDLIEIRSVALDKQKVNEFTLAVQIKRQAPAVNTQPGAVPAKAPPAKAPPAKSSSANSAAGSHQGPQS
jgi:hypothetical protein